MKKQVTNMDLYQAYCAANHANETLLLIDYIETGEGTTVSDEVFESIAHIRDKITKTTTEMSVVDIYTIPEDCVSEVLRLAHNNKWGWGDCVYIWQRNKIVWGRD